MCNWKCTANGHLYLWSLNALVRWIRQCQWRRGNWWSGHGKAHGPWHDSSLTAVRGDQWFSCCSLQPYSGLTVPESGDGHTIQDECTEFIHWNWEHGRDLLLIFWSQFSEIALEFQSTDFINYLQAIESAARKISRLIILPTDFNEWLTVETESLGVRFCSLFHQCQLKSLNG